MRVLQKQSNFSFSFTKKGNLQKLKDLFQHENVIRFAIINNDSGAIDCEYATVDNKEGYEIKNIFDFNPLITFNRSNFNAIMIIPTGIGAEVGGDSGDANPAARLIGNVVDNLITHPNVVNAADINEMTPNTLYVEGSVLNRFIMGTVGLAPVRGNRMLLIFDTPEKEYIKNFTINTASAARVTLGCEIDTVELTDPPKYYYYYNENNIAVGKIENLEKLINLIRKYQTDYDSIVLHTSLESDSITIAKDYFEDRLAVNPWGGIEAMITHTVSNFLDVSIAHAPLFTEELLRYTCPIVNPKKSPETLSKTELFCVIKGMYKTPKIVEPISQPGVLTNRDIHALITPDRCISLPLLAALEQNIPVIAVEDGANVMKNDLSKLPWPSNQFFKAKNYLEAAGLLIALKSGISPNSVKRPVDHTKIL